MKRKLPKRIRVGGHTLKVAKRKNLMEHAEAYGMFDATELTITIDDKLNDSLCWETFWHEVVEAINHFAEADMEHKTIQTFGLLLHQVVESVLSGQGNKP